MLPSLIFVVVCPHHITTSTITHFLPRAHTFCFPPRHPLIRQAKKSSPPPCLLIHHMYPPPPFLLISTIFTHPSAICTHPRHFYPHMSVRLRSGTRRLHPATAPLRSTTRITTARTPTRKRTKRQMVAVLCMLGSTVCLAALAIPYGKVSANNTRGGAMTL